MPIAKGWLLREPDIAQHRTQLQERRRHSSISDYNAEYEIVFPEALEAQHVPQGKCPFVSAVMFAVWNRHDPSGKSCGLLDISSEAAIAASEIYLACLSALPRYDAFVDIATFAQSVPPSDIDQGRYEWIYRNDLIEPVAFPLTNLHKIKIGIGSSCKKMLEFISDIRKMEVMLEYSLVDNPMVVCRTPASQNDSTDRPLRFGSPTLSPGAYSYSPPFGRKRDRTKYGSQHRDQDCRSHDEKPGKLIVIPGSDDEREVDV